MRIAVVGAGAMGSLFGGLLAESGCDVRLIDVAGAQLDALRAGGLWLVTDAGSRHIVVRAGLAATQTEPCDLLVVFTKSMDTARAMRSVAHLLGPGGWVLTLQNGIGNAEAIRTAMPGVRLAIGMTSYPADLVAPGRVQSHGGGTVRLWSDRGGHHPMLDQLAERLNGAGLHCLADPAVEVAIWEKLAFNAALNALCAITRRQVGAVADRPEGRRLALAASSEALAVAAALGLGVDPARVARAIAAAFVDHREHTPSMLQDILAGRPVEVDAINGAVVAAGVRTGVPTPVNAVLQDLLKLIDPAAPVLAMAGDLACG